MARFVVSSDEFSKLLEIRRRLISDGTVLPAKVFRADYNLFKVMEYPFALSSEFLEPIMALSWEIGFEEIILMMINPDPFQYYYQRFQKYGAIIVGRDDTSEDIMTLCFEQSPPDDPGEPFTLLVHTFAMFPFSQHTPEWCMYRDRLHCEAGIIGFRDKDIAERFLRIDRDHIAKEASEAIETFILHPWQEGLPEGFIREFLTNYGTNE